MAQSDIVDKDAHVQTVDELLHVVVVGILVLGKVHSQRLDGNLGAILGCDVGRERVQLRLGARDEDQVVALGCKGQGEFLANAVRGTSDKGPGTARSKGAQLVGVRNIGRKVDSRFTYRLAWQHEQAEEHSNSANDRCCKGRNAYKQKTVDGSLHKGIAGINVHTKGLGDAAHDDSESQQKQQN